MTISKKQILGITFIILLIFALLLTVFLSKKRQDIRPRAMQGKANLLLSADTNSSNVGKTIDVLVSLQLTDPSLKVSGADFLLLYDKSKLDVKNIIPAIPGTSIPKPAFTDTLLLTSGGIFDATFNYLRVVEIAKKTDTDLSSATLTLAKVTFLAKGEGAAVIKFPEDNKYLEVVGTSTNILATPTPGGPTVTPTSTPTSTPTPQPPPPPTNTPIPPSANTPGPPPCRWHWSLSCKCRNKSADQPGSMICKDEHIDDPGAGKSCEDFVTCGGDCSVKDFGGAFWGCH